MTSSVLRSISPDLIPDAERYVSERQFIPGGRYLYAAGRKRPCINNCLSGDTRIITDTGVLSLTEAALLDEVNVRNRYGEWERATVRHFGFQPLCELVFADGSVVHATPDHRWWQRDGSCVTTLELAEVPFSVPAQIPEVDPEGVRHGIIFGDGHLATHGDYSVIRFVNQLKGEELVAWFPLERIKRRYRWYDTVRRASNGDWVVSLQPSRYKNLPNARTCTPEYARGFIAGLIATDGSTKTSSVTIAQHGAETIRALAELAVLGGCVVTSTRTRTLPNPWTGEPRVLGVMQLAPRYAPLIRPSQDRWQGRGREVRGAKRVRSIRRLPGVWPVYCAVVPETESFTLAGGYYTRNCFLLEVGDSRQEWARLVSRATELLMVGGGIGVVYSKVREEGAAVAGLGGKATGPLSPMHMVNEIGRNVMQGGSRRSAIWAGLHWSHPDIFKFITAKDWPEHIAESKRRDFNAYAPLDHTNISVILDDEFFHHYRAGTGGAREVYEQAIAHALETGEPGFSIDIGANAGEHLRNACCEITSSSDNDVCNLGSINLARLEDEDELCRVTHTAIGFLLAGTIYGQVPLREVRKVRDRNRRLGLGVMGVAEWLAVRGRRYAPDQELGRWLDLWAWQAEMSAEWWARRFGVPVPIKTRAIAPNGTISIIGETTSGIEPVFCAAMKRRWLEEGRTWKVRYVIDAAAKRLLEQGVKAEDIEDAYTLAADPERRIALQSFVQERVDHGISSTLNLPSYDEQTFEPKEFASVLYDYLPRLRGVTMYPDNSRGGQPLVRVPLDEALEKEGLEYEEAGNEQSCVNGVCGI